MILFALSCLITEIERPIYLETTINFKSTIVEVVG